MTTLKEQIQTWSDALDAYDAEDYEKCVTLFQTIAEESRIHFNIGIVHATLGAHETALVHFQRAFEADRFMAVAYFQSGVSNFLLDRFEDARRDFDDAFVYMRDNQTIDYEQIGLKFRLYSCEVLFNRGLCLLYLGKHQEGLSDMRKAASQKQTSEHGVIDEAVADSGRGYTVFSIPVGVLYRPSDMKLKNLKAKNYLGSAKLVAATDSQDAFTGFTGSTLARNATMLRTAAAAATAQLDAQKPRLGTGRSDTGSSTRSRSDGHRTALSEGAPTGPLPPLPTNVAPLQRSLTKITTSVLNESGREVASPLSATSSTTSNPRNRSHTLPHRKNSLPTFPGQPKGQSKNPTGFPSPPSSEERNPRDQARGTTYGLDLESHYGGEETELAYSKRTPPPRPLPPSIFAQQQQRQQQQSRKPSGQPVDRVADWARKNAGALPFSHSSSPSISRKTSTSDVVVGGGFVAAARNSPVRSQTLHVPATHRERSTASPVSGSRDGNDGTSVIAGPDREITRIRVKLRLEEDVRGMSIVPDMALEDFSERVRVKFQAASDFVMKYKDEDGVCVSIIDSDDWESAMLEAQATAKGRSEGKLEIFLTK